MPRGVKKVSRVLDSVLSFYHLDMCERPVLSSRGRGGGVSNILLEKYCK